MMMERMLNVKNVELNVKIVPDTDVLPVVETDN